MSEAQPVSLDDILITASLAERSPRVANLQAEIRSLHSLARQLAQQPQTMLQALVATAVELCLAGSAGVSLLDVTPDGEEIFRWSAISGSLKEYEQRTTPRNYSPCGICLDRQAPILYSYPERYFTYLQTAKLSIVEGLVIPLMNGDQPLGTIWIVSHDPARQFDAEDLRIMTSLADFTSAALDSIHLRQTTEVALQHQHFLANATKVLAESIDYKTTLLNIAQLAVPFLADLCFFDVLNTDSQIERVGWHHREQDWFEQLQHYLQLPDCESHLFTNLLDSSQANFVPYVTKAWLQNATTCADCRQFMQEFQVRSLISVPLIAHGHHLGVLTVCLTADSDRQYIPADLAVAEELGHGAALALSNARLYQQAQEANRIKDEFLAVLSHELRSPLNPILGWLQMIKRGNLSATQTAQAWATIERNAKLQAKLVDDLLDVSAILQGKLSLNVEQVNLVATIQAAIDTVQLSAQAKSIEINTRLNSQVVTILGDATRLQQVAWNLLANAVKFTPQGGRVEVGLEQIEGYAQIVVSDTGIGIDPNFLPYVFDYFWQVDGATTRQFGGLGLGLAIVRQIIEAHGGTVWAESLGKGQGAIFTLRLPLMPAQATKEGDKLLEDAVNLQGTQILVVDNEPDSLEFIALALEQSGANVITANSAAEALQLFTQSQPTLLISDIGMPDEDGYMLMQQVRALPPEQGGQVLAIALTAYAGYANYQQAIAAGFQHHLVKPVDPEVLIKAITDLLKENQP
ncbi:ATP-binding protein [Nostoc sp. MS1]|uniref:hybrid sensor histidine kinase/response regulator n=1 Tax=Nostoc sp. MS1 TaxID=2764711 RepID=UPI001CC51A87|nr:ATP-binding protein [Nostoc sp. MS1]BCL36350.1 hypothetical protein NSMS1_27970 [Nostoc sp. MS1]